jgi:toxin ParE1/3/4
VSAWARFATRTAPAQTCSISGFTSRAKISDQVYDRIEEKCRVLRDHPQLGPARPEFAEGARSLLIERWLALYRLVEDGVQVVRIIDGARDLTKIEWTPE